MKTAKKHDGRRSTLWALGVILMVLAIGFSIGWATRGPRIHDFTGIGQAEILDVTTYERGDRERVDIVYRFKVRITAGEDTFIDRYDHSSKSEWRQGDILPIAYNVNNPREYVIGDTPQGYARWYRTIGAVTLVLTLGAVYCLGMSFRMKREAAEDSEMC